MPPSADQALRGELAALLPVSEAELGVVRPADRVAVALSRDRLLSAVGDLWYPGADDLVIVHRSGDHTLVVVLDHEERLMAARLAPPPPA
ncbi:hypothetical protein ACFY7C_26800 [Streptomyces sp. NPDC012769]|uniref:hypothetical protein n=1 Tax=Streptomyces sp. NPDC012769 TaxID=3364848 RepID=UPI003691C034